ncbi:MAG: hypothetical protein KF916_04600 [Microbacteriaceae bacterium]|nr:hypothetical protein [Microbacteriaceae bacterium]
MALTNFQTDRAIGAVVASVAGRWSRDRHLGEGEEEALVEAHSPAIVDLFAWTKQLLP